MKVQEQPQKGDNSLQPYSISQSHQTIWLIAREDRLHCSLDVHIVQDDLCVKIEAGIPFCQMSQVTYIKGRETLYSTKKLKLRWVLGTLWRVWTTFTRSAITPSEVNGFGWNLGHSEYIVWSWPWQIFVPRRSESGSAGRFFVFFCQVNNARLYRFSVGQISRNLLTRRGSATWWILSEQNFQNLPARVGYFPKPTSSRTTSDFIQR